MLRCNKRPIFSYVHGAIPRRDTRSQKENEVKVNREIPDFSFIRSASERAEAQRGYEIGLAMADGLFAAGEVLQRAINGVVRTVSRKQIASY